MSSTCQAQTADHALGRGRGLLGFALLLTKETGQLRRREVVLALGLSGCAHHRGGQHGQQFAGGSGVHAAGLAQAGLDSLLPPAEQMTKNR